MNKRPRTKEPNRSIVGSGSEGEGKFILAYEFWLNPRTKINQGPAAIEA